MRNNIRRWFAPLAVVVGLIGASPQVKAQLLPPGGIIAPPGAYQANAALPPAADTGVLPWAIFGTDSGTVREIVVANDLNNPLHGLDFIYQLTVGRGSLSQIALNNFSGFVTAVFQSINAPAGPWNLAGQAPFAVGTLGAGAAASADRSLDGAVINFKWIPSVTPGQTTYVVFVLTDAQFFTQTPIGIIDSGSTNAFGFGPAANPRVPEPGSIVILASCFLGLGGAYSWIRRRGAPTAA
jgi:hypothetical protein